jgi:hypothetical protein
MTSKGWLRNRIEEGEIADGAKDDSKQKLERKKSKRMVRIKRAAEIEHEHAEAFRRPLISDDLLTERERAETRKKIACCGQLHWRHKGDSL